MTNLMDLPAEIHTKIIHRLLFVPTSNHYTTYIGNFHVIQVIEAMHQFRASRHCLALIEEVVRQMMARRIKLVKRWKEYYGNPKFLTRAFDKTCEAVEIMTQYMQGDKSEAGLKEDLRRLGFRIAGLTQKSCLHGCCP